MWDVSSGKLRVCCWTCPFMLSFSRKHDDFHVVNYSSVSLPEGNHIEWYAMYRNMTSKSPPPTWGDPFILQWRARNVRGLPQDQPRAMVAIIFFDVSSGQGKGWKMVKTVWAPHFLECFRPSVEILSWLEISDRTLRTLRILTVPRKCGSCVWREWDQIRR